jgi:hypothetical protein
MAKSTCIIYNEPFEECGNDGSQNGNDSQNGNGSGDNTCFDGTCVEVRDGVLCPVDNFRSPWELTENTSEACLTDSYITEQLNIGGADVNVYKLLGIHEQGKLVDLTGDGTPISGGAHPNFPAINSFDLFKTEWRSVQIGQDVVKSAYIGYDFGEIKLDNGRNRYGVETFKKHNISRIRIAQGCDSINRATKVRLERSHDGERWFGVGIRDVADCDGIVTLDFPASVPSRFWRIRPVTFNGSDTDYWSVQALQLIEYEATALDNIQDKIFMENRDRDYSEFPEKLKGSYSPFDSQSFFAKWGSSSGIGGEQYFIELSWSAVIKALGRPIVIGDIIELPSEKQYTASLTPVLKYLEVADIDWSPNGYSAQWIPLMVRIIATPAYASPETQDIFGKMTQDYDEMGVADTGDGVNNKKYQDIFDVDHTIQAEADTAVPERGEDTANVTKFSDEVYEWSEENNDAKMQKYDRARNFWAQDGMPPNGEPFTTGDEFPDNPKDRDYHRLTYTKIRQGIPPRLYRYSESKGTWIFMETDRRAYESVIRRRLQEFSDTESSTVTRPDEIDEEFKKD